MAATNKTVLQTANEAIRAGDNEAFLAFCTDDIVWDAIGEPILRGKDAVREWMKRAYAEPPSFDVAELIAENDWVVATGSIDLRGDRGETITHAYCDVWRFREGKMAELRAFVVAPGGWRPPD